jgi:hypothetical protein
LERIADVTIMSIVGENRGDNISGMVQRPYLESVFLDGRGFSRPILVLDSVYEAQLTDVHTLGWFVQHMRLSNVWDSRFMNGTAVGGGMRDPTAPPTTDEERRAGFNFGIPMVELITPNLHHGTDSCNNLYWYGYRWESQPNNAILMLLHGNNGVMHTYHACKWEGIEGNSPQLVAMDQVSITFSGCWVMGGGTGRAPGDIGGMPGGTPFANYPNPGVFYCNFCRGLYGDMCMAYHDWNAAPLRAMVNLVGCESAAFSVFVIQGLNSIDRDSGIIRAERSTDLQLRATAQSWAWSQASEPRPAPVVIV